MRTLQTFSLFGVLLAAGCNQQSAHRRAETLAREDLVQVLEYEAALKAVANETSRYYKQMLNNLEDDFTSMLRVDSKSTFATLAGDAADATIELGFNDLAFREYFAEAQALQQSQEDRVERQLESLRGEMKEFLEKMDVQAKKLKSLKTKLEILQTPQSTGEILKELKPVFEAIERARAGSASGNTTDTASESESGS